MARKADQTPSECIKAQSQATCALVSGVSAQREIKVHEDESHLQCNEMNLHHGALFLPCQLQHAVHPQTLALPFSLQDLWPRNWTNVQFPQPDTALSAPLFLSEKGCTSKTQHRSFMSKLLSTISGLSQTKIDIAAKMLFVSFSELKAALGNLASSSAAV